MLKRKTPLKSKNPLRSTEVKKRSAGRKKTKRHIYGVRVWSLKVADTKFSLWLREQRGYTCERCGRYEAPPTWNIQNSHYIGRKHMMTRFDVDNCDVLCSTCHAFFEDAKQYEYRDWKIRKLGLEKHNALILKARNSLGQKDAIYNCMVLLKALSPTEML